MDSVALTFVQRVIIMFALVAMMAIYYSLAIVCLAQVIANIVDRVFAGVLQDFICKGLTV
jgi:hypothetical protein